MFTIINDTHIGVERQAGATPASREKLKETLRESFNHLLKEAEGDVIHAGDLFDTTDVDNAEMVAVYQILHSWLLTTGKKYYAFKANHDDHPRGHKVSSWELLHKVLKSIFPDQVFLIRDKLTNIAPNVWGIGHCPNQDLFDIELDKALKLENSVLVFHANYDNHFAEQSDQSLNVSKEWAQKFVARGNLLVGAHEHQRREELGGKVVMMGNQFPSSISDCLGNDFKYYHTLDGTTLELKEHELISIDKLYVDVDWQDLKSVTGKGFVRVSGKATFNQASDVLNVIAKFRQESSAYVVSNAVEIEGIASMDDVQGASLEQIRGFNVQEALFELLTEQEKQTVNELLKEES